MPTATWNGVVLAESDDTVIVEGNHYFPMSSVNEEYLTQNQRTSVCPWKGTANYFDIAVSGSVNAGAAWTYKKPKSAAAEIANHVAFWNGVEVQ